MTASHDAGSDIPALDRPPYLLIFAPAVVGIIAAVVVFAFYPQIPDPVPTHWDVSGSADAFSEKTPLTVYGFALWPVIFGVVLNLFIVGMIRVIAAEKPLASQTTDDHLYERKIYSLNFQQRAVARFISLMISLLVVVMVLNLAGLISGIAVILVTVIVIVVPVIILARDLGRINDLITKHYPNDYTPHLKWGMFYYNPKDNRSIIEFNGSTTVNFGSRGGRLMMLALLLPMILVTVIAIVAGS